MYKQSWEKYLENHKGTIVLYNLEAFLIVGYLHYTYNYGYKYHCMELYSRGEIKHATYLGCMLLLNAMGEV